MSPLKRDDFYYVYILRDIDVTKYDILYTLIYVISLEKNRNNFTEKRFSFPKEESRWITKIVSMNRAKITVA